MKPGTIILTADNNWGAKVVRALQVLNGDASKWNHVALALDNGELFEARPSGAAVVKQTAYRGRKVALISREEYGATDAQVACMTAYARTLNGTGYNWDTYFYLAAYRLPMPLTERLLRKRVSKSSKLICSQAVDAIAWHCGVHLFTDGRKPYDVTPGDFAKRFLRG
jgi:hypothetical protein